MTMSLTDYADNDALGLAALIREKAVSPREAAALARQAMQRVNPVLNAVIDPMEAQLEPQLSALPGGPLSGVPFLLKDLGASFAGVPTHSGSRFFHGSVLPYDSEIVRRWRAAGLVVLGKTNTPELGSSSSTEPVSAGATRNPWNPKHSPGGSSGGAAAAVAAGIVPAAHASDGAGSIRIPASCCGVVGLKPSRGRNSLGPDAGEIWDGMVAEHVVSRSVRDTAALLDVAAGYAVGDPYMAPPPSRPFLAEVGADPGRLRIGVSFTAVAGQTFHPDCVAAVAHTAKLLESQGHHVEEAQPAGDHQDLLDSVVMTFFAANVAFAVAEQSAVLSRQPGPGDLERSNLWLADRGRRFTAIDYLRAARRLNVFTRAFAGFFERYDLWLTPTLASPPPLLGHLDADMADVETFFRRLWAFNPINVAYNASGQPAITLPLFWTAEGLPVGTMLGARMGGEATLLRVAAQLEAAQPWRNRHPPISVWA
jgi:amidase